jgi:hypothetical protein
MNPRRQLGGNTIIFGKQNKTLKSSLIDFSGQKAIFLLTIGQNLGKGRLFFSLGRFSRQCNHHWETKHNFKKLLLDFL